MHWQSRGANSHGCQEKLPCVKLVLGIHCPQCRLCIATQARSQSCITLSCGRLTRPSQAYCTFYLGLLLTSFKPIFPRVPPANPSNHSRLHCCTMVSQQRSHRLLQIIKESNSVVICDYTKNNILYPYF